MLALYRSGRQSEALEAYRQARRSLTDGLGIEPGPELRRLQEQILAQDPALDAPAPSAELAPQLEGGSPLLAGRERELGWLRERWDETRSGGSTVALVSGPAGIGKTRLVAELARDVHRGGASVIYAAGSGARSRAGRGPPRGREPAADAPRHRRRRRYSARGARGRGGSRREAARAAPAHPRAAPGRTQPTGAGGTRARRRLASPGARAPGSRRGRGDRRPVRTRRRPRDPGRAPDRRERRGAARAAPRGQRLGSSAGEPATGGNGRQGGGRARRPPHGAGGAGRERCRSSGGARARRSVSGRAGRPIGARGLPVPGPGPVRCRARRVLLRARATGCRPRRARRRLDLACGRGAFGQRQVLGASRRPAARAGERDAAGLRALAAIAHPTRRASARGAAARPRAPCAAARVEGDGADPLCGDARLACTRRAPGPRRRSVRGDVHRLPRRGRARRLHRRTRRRRGRHRPARPRRARDPGRLLRSLRRVPQPVGADQRQQRARRADGPRGAAAGDRAPGAQGGFAGRARAGLGARRRRRRPTRRAAAAVDQPCSSSGRSEAGGPCARRATRSAAA